MPIEKIMVVGRDPEHLEALLRQRHYEAALAPTLGAAQECLSQDEFDLVFADAWLPDGDCGDLLARLRAQRLRPLCIILSPAERLDAALGWLRHGAFDYLMHPVSPAQLDAGLCKAERFNRLQAVNQFLSLGEDWDTGYEIIGVSSAMEKVRQSIRKVARTNASVLIQGEIGSGKEVVARALHQQSDRGSGPFIRMDCTALPKQMLEPVLVGQEKGVSANVLETEIGRLEMADGGTIFINEVGDLPQTAQEQLLRLLQEGVVERLGARQPIPTDARVMASSSRNLEEAIAQNQFREDLFFRLNIVPIQLPPLRERQEDIPLLAEHFRKRFGHKYQLQAAAFSADALDILQRHAWQGNVHELQGVVERAVLACGAGSVIEAPHLSLAAAGESESAARRAESDEPDDTTLAAVEKRHIFAVLEACSNNRTHAAKRLGISIRTLRNKLREYRQKTAEADGEE